MRLIHLIWIGALLTTAACQPAQKSDDHAGHADHAQSSETAAAGPVAKKEQEILAVHDSLMAEMSDLMRLKKAVSAKAAAPAANGQGTEISRRLGEADDAMMTWMNQYNGDTLGKLGQTKALDYLNDQQNKVNQVRDQMRRSMADANAYLGKKP